MSADSVLQFWFEELEPKQWWQKNSELDQLIEQRFGSLHAKAKLGELYSWRDEAHSSLAEVLILDQFSRNIYRNKAEAFAYDGMALVLSQSAIGKGFNQQLSQVEQQFLYLPFMHSESRLIHQQAVDLFAELGEGYGYDFEVKHKEIIDRFGRYPHRNEVLERETTPEEREFLKQPGSSF